MRRTILAVLACMLAMVAIGVTYKTIKGHSQIQAALKKCAAVVAPHSVYAQGVTVLWSANMESNGDPGPDLGQWYSPSCCASANNGGGIFSSGIASAGPSFDYNHTPGGTYSAMLKIATPSTPTSGTRLFRWLEPQTYPALYYSVWYYFPQVYTPNGTPDAWWNVLQWKSKHCPGGVCSTDPFFVLNVGNRPGTGAMCFYLYNNQTLTHTARP